MKKTFYQEGNMALDVKSGRMSKKGFDIINTENPEQKFSLSCLTSSLSSYSKDAPLYLNQNGKRILLLDLNGREFEFSSIKDAITISKQYAVENKIDLVVSDELVSICDDPVINNILDSNGYRRPLFFSELERIADMGIPVKISLIGSDIDEPISALSKMGEHMFDINNLMLPNNLKTEVILDNKYLDRSVQTTMYNKEDGCNAKMDNVSIKRSKNNNERETESINFRITDTAKSSIFSEDSLYDPKRDKPKEFSFPSIDPKLTAPINITITMGDTKYKFPEQDKINQFINDNPKVSVAMLDSFIPKNLVYDIIKITSRMLKTDDKKQRERLEIEVRTKIQSISCSDKAKKNMFNIFISNNAFLLPQWERFKKIKNILMVNNNAINGYDLVYKEFDKETLPFINKVIDEQSEEISNQYNANEVSPLPS